MLALADAIVLSHVADATLLLARWQKTNKNIVKEAAKKIENSRINLAGIVLSRVDVEKQSRYVYDEEARS